MNLVKWNSKNPNFRLINILDENLTNLKIVKSSLSSRLETEHRDLKKAKKEGDVSKITRCEANISVLEKNLTVADIELEIYLAKKKLGSNPESEKDRQFFTRKEQELEEARSKLPKTTGQSSQSLQNVSKAESSGSK